MTDSCICKNTRIKDLKMCDSHTFWEPGRRVFVLNFLLVTQKNVAIVYLNPQIQQTTSYFLSSFVKPFFWKTEPRSPNPSFLVTIVAAYITCAVHSLHAQHQSRWLSGPNRVADSISCLNITPLPVAWDRGLIRFHHLDQKPEFRYRNNNKTWELISILGAHLFFFSACKKIWSISAFLCLILGLWLFPQGRPRGGLMRWASSALVFWVSGFCGTCSFFVVQSGEFFQPYRVSRRVRGLVVALCKRASVWVIFVFCARPVVGVVAPLKKKKKKLLGFLRGTIKGAWSLILLRRAS